MSVLVIAEHNNQSLTPATLNTVAAAGQIDSDIHILVAGNDCGDAVQAAAAVAGVAKVVHADSTEYANNLAENFAPLIKDVAVNYSHVLASASTFGKNVMPRAAALLDVQQISDITTVVDSDTFVRPIYAGNAMATVKSNDAIKLLTVRSTGFEAVADTGGNAAVETLDFSIDTGLSSYLGSEITESERPELTSAKTIISGGRGMKNGENFSMLENVADKLNAAVGASRAAVDAGFVPSDYQIGQTGKVVAPDLYIAVGLSGAIQHLAGMKDSKVIVAINNDEDAPIFEVADYGLLADLFDAIPELDAAL
ncbi:MAG: FAD-binding protein [Arenicella sp.]